MNRYRWTIPRWMALTAVFAWELGLVRGFLIAEQWNECSPVLNPTLLGCLALPFVLWRYRRTSGRHRRFSLGFGASGLAAALAVAILSEAAPDLDNWYTGEASDLAYHVLPARLDVMFSTEHWDWFLAIIYFLPELLAAAVGGTLAACLYGAGGGGVRRERKPVGGVPGAGCPY